MTNTAAAVAKSETEVKSRRLVPIQKVRESVGTTSMTTIYRLLRAGELGPLIKQGRRSFVLEDAVHRYIDRLVSAQCG
ncbi:hypothetical protein B1810_22095 [Panacagrimonas perspica]|uniref:DNA-binding protein n=1 Tax=Panacagrimonas perspica TaxID=381431 RepID=UPI00105D9FDC|nr:DNA-binding protein [Panacagrimonas perspica]THD01015.1 hypothetical protein B1810_22095 [Panacagrimonas perspica]